MKLVPLVKRSLSEEQVRRCVKAGRQDALRLLMDDHVNIWVKKTLDRSIVCHLFIIDLVIKVFFFPVITLS